VNADRSASLHGSDEGVQLAAVARLEDLFSGGSLSLERFSRRLEQVLAASGHAELEAAMVALPPLVRLTPASLRLARPLVLQVADSDLRLGSGWQLAADTTIGTGFGAARIDLAAASWDADQIDLRLQTWGSIDVVVPTGVAVQLVGGSARVQLESLSPPVPGGPLLRICTFGPTGLIRIRHPTETRRTLKRWRRRRTRPVGFG
jgi:hypothetical protein